MSRHVRQSIITYTFILTLFIVGMACQILGVSL